MQVILQGRNVQITDRLREYVESKVEKLDRYLPSAGEARMELAIEQTKSAEDRHVAQLTIRSKGVLLRSEERSSDMFTSVDMVMDKIRRQIDRYKSKRRGRFRSGQAEQLAALEEDDLEDLPEGRIVRTKRFQVTPMGPEEAVEQMELLGHSFFVFYNVQEDQINVVYRRNDGDYGLLQPDMD
jgi:putative sigma-54 modulation protein